MLQMEYSGMPGVMSPVVSSEQKNALMMESMLEVSGVVPFFPRWIWVVCVCVQAT